MTEALTELPIAAPPRVKSKARYSAPVTAPSALPSDWKAPLVLVDGRSYQVLSVEIQKPQAGLVDQSVVVRRCILEVSAGYRHTIQRFIVNAYSNAFRRRLLNIQRPETLVMWTRRWAWQYLSHPQRQVQADDHKRLSDGSIVVECW